MFVVKDNNPAVGFVIGPGHVEDAEGNAIDHADLTITVESTDPAIVAVSQDAGDQKKGSASFGKPGTASVNVTVKAGDTLLGSFGAQFTVTTGDPAAISGGAITFDGLTEAPTP